MYITSNACCLTSALRRGSAACRAVRVASKYSQARFSSSSPIQVAKSGVTHEPGHRFSIGRSSPAISRYSDGVTVRMFSAPASRRYIPCRKSLPSLS